MANEFKSKYPWGKWSGALKDGQAWMVTRWVDYDCESSSFASQIYQEAKRRNMAVTVATFEGYVLFVFYKRDSLWRPNLPAYKDVQKLRRKYQLGR